MIASKIVDQVISLYDARGHRHYGEEVTELQHALQCARLARMAGEPDSMVAACLLHDYGHLLHEAGENIAERGVDAKHEVLGADRLAAYFKSDVIDPIRLHVAAKRYMCWRQSTYFNGLSASSRLSLRLQGGVMTDSESAAFACHPYADAAQRLRLYDDAAKVTDLATPGIESYRSLLEGLLS